MRTSKRVLAMHKWLNILFKENNLKDIKWVELLPYLVEDLLIITKINDK